MAVTQGKQKIHTTNLSGLDKLVLGHRVAPIAHRGIAKNCHNPREVAQQVVKGNKFVESHTCSQGRVKPNAQPGVRHDSHLCDEH